MFSTFNDSSSGVLRNPSSKKATKYLRSIYNMVKMYGSSLDNGVKKIELSDVNIMLVEDPKHGGFLSIIPPPSSSEFKHDISGTVKKKWYHTKPKIEINIESGEKLDFLEIINGCLKYKYVKKSQPSFDSLKDYMIWLEKSLSNSRN